MKRNIEQRHIVAYLDSFSLSGDLRQARLASLREPHKGVILQSQTGEKLDALLPPSRPRDAPTEQSALGSP